MTLIVASRVPETVDPEHTARKRLDAWMRKLAKEGEPEVMPGLDLDALRAKYNPSRAYEPRMMEATFMVPLSVSEAAFATEQGRKVWKWVDSMMKRGWDWCRDKGVQIYPGRYPAHDLRDQSYVLDHREFVARAWFKKRDPQPVRTEINPRLLRSVRAGGD